MCFISRKNFFGLFFSFQIFFSVIYKFLAIAFLTFSFSSLSFSFSPTTPFPFFLPFPLHLRRRRGRKIRRRRGEKKSLWKLPSFPIYFRVLSERSFPTSKKKHPQNKTLEKKISSLFFFLKRGFIFLMFDMDFFVRNFFFSFSIEKKAWKTKQNFTLFLSFRLLIFSFFLLSFSLFPLSSFPPLTSSFFLIPHHPPPFFLFGEKRERERMKKKKKEKLGVFWGEREKKRKTTEKNVFL